MEYKWIINMFDSAGLSPARYPGKPGRGIGASARQTLVIPGCQRLCMNLKKIIRTFLWFVNFQTMLKLTVRWMRMRKNRVLFIFEGKEYTYGEVYEQATRYANFFLSERKKLVDAGKLGKKDRLALGVYMENTPEYVFASFAAGLSNSVLFAINTGLPRRDAGESHRPGEGIIPDRK